MTRTTAALLATTALSFAASAAFAAEEGPLDRITVIATKNPIEAFSYPGAVTVVDKEAIDDLATSNIADLFADIPGVNFGSGPRRTGNVPSMRGIEGEGVLVLFDGVRQDFLSGHDGRFFIDPDMLSGVEVVRGPSSALYGSSALGGVIAFRTLEASDVLGEDETFAISLKGGYQGVSEEWSGGASLFARSEDGRYEGVANITKRSSGDIALGNGLDLQSEDEILTGLVKGTAHLTEDLTAQFTWISFNNEALEPNNGQGANTGDLVEKDISSNTLRAGLTYAPENNDLVDANLIAYGAFTEVQEDEVASTRSITREVESYGIVFDNRSKVLTGDTLTATLTYGGDYYRNEQVGRDNATSDGTRGGVPDATSNTYGLFAQAEITALTDIGTFTLIPAIRYDRFQNEAAGAPETDDDALSPKIGVSYRPADWALLFANYSEAFRAPSFNEIYADDIHFTIPLGPGLEAPNFFIPNPDLESEISQTWEMGGGVTFGDMLFEGDHFAAKGSYFRSDVENLIDLEVDFTFSPSCFVPQIPGPCTSGTSRNVNTKNALLDGFELEASYDSARIYWTAAFSSIDGEDQDTGGYVGILTPNRVSLNLGLKLPEADSRFGVRATFADDFDKADDPSEYRDGYSVFDLYYVWTPEAIDGLRVDLGVDNVADEDYEVVFAGVPASGRNPKAIVRWQGSF